MYVRVLAATAASAFLGGAVAGALPSGWDTSMTHRGEVFSLMPDFGPLVALFGGMLGAAFGLALALWMSLARIGSLRSALAGAAVGALWAAGMAAGWNAHPFRSTLSKAAPPILSLLLWTLLGLLLSRAGMLLRPRRGRVPSAPRRNKAGEIRSRKTA